MKVCAKHNVPFHLVGNSGRYRCRKCMTEAVSRRRLELKRLAVEKLGGKCVRCGYNKCAAALEFHHRGNKSFGLSAKGITRSWRKIEQELTYCELICANCHREEHYDVR